MNHASISVATLATPPLAVKTRPAARVGDGSRTSRRGFASMDPAEQRRIASEGGKASHASGQGHKWTAAEAREAGSAAVGAPAAPVMRPPPRRQKQPNKPPQVMGLGAYLLSCVIFDTNWPANGQLKRPGFHAQMRGSRAFFGG